MGYYVAIGDCFGCGQPFSFNPHRVPSHPDDRGIRQPICRNCVQLVNLGRQRNGLDLIVPLPGAYEPEPETDYDDDYDDEDSAWPRWLRQTPDGFEIVDRE